MRKFWFIFLILPLLAGCYARSGGIPLFNNYGYNYSPTKVVVQKGDTLYGLSQKYEVPLKSIIEANNLHQPYSLKVGQVLKLPINKKHIVKKGETLYAISRNYNVDVSTLGSINNLPPPYSLKVGQTIKLPDVSVAQNSSGGSSSVFFKSKKQNNTKVTQNKTSKSKQTSQSKIKRKTVSTYRKTKFVWPVNGSIVSGFGVVGNGRKNDGINIKAALGSNIKAADKGIVAYAGNELKGFGNLVLIKHSDGYITAYAHADKIYVKKGQRVLRGEKIATVGKTGSVNTPQLHFEVRAGKKAVNPRQYLP